MKNFIFISPHFPDHYRRFAMALKERGWRVLGIGDAPYNELPEGCKEAIVEYYCCPNMDDFENERRAVAYFVKKYGKIDFLESNNEYRLDKDARLRTEFGIDSGENVYTINRFKYKSLEKLYFEAAGARCARYTLSNDLGGIEEFASLVGYPLFVKPDVGVGAHGAKKLTDRDDVLKFLETREKDVNYIIEEYVDGEIVSFDGISDSKGEVVFCTNDFFTVDNSEIVSGGFDDCYYCLPTIDPSFEAMGRTIVRSFKLNKRFFHIEFFKLKEDHPYLGKKGTMVPLEGNMRPAGGYTPDLINFANSVSCYEIYADVVTYDKITVDLNMRKYVAVASSRRYSLKYLHSTSEVLAKYPNNITMYGDYPRALRDDMGDYYFFAKFDSVQEAMDFDTFVRGKA